MSTLECTLQDISNVTYKMQYAYMVEWVGYICIGSLPMTDERFIMVDHHIYISIEKNTSKIIYSFSRGYHLPLRFW